MRMYVAGYNFPLAAHSNGSGERLPSRGRAGIEDPHSRLRRRRQHSQPGSCILYVNLSPLKSPQRLQVSASR